MEAQDLLGISFIIITVFLIFIWLSKRYQEIKSNRLINKGLVYPRPSAEEMRQEQQAFQKQMIRTHNEYYEKMFAGKEFINQNTSSLNDFIINTEMNGYDLHKLAQLNGIKVEMAAGWTDLALNLMMELDKTGWNREVASIKEKFGELRFYAATDREDILDKYSKMSKSICEICGKPGEHFSEHDWDFTRCEQHRKT